MGFADKKGSIEVGKDADIVIWNSSWKKKLSVNNLHQKCDYTPFENYITEGYPIITIIRGRVIVENNMLW